MSHQLSVLTGLSGSDLAAEPEGMKRIKNITNHEPESFKRKEIVFFKTKHNKHIDKTIGLFAIWTSGISVS